MTLLCKVEVMCIHGEVNWAMFAVVIPLVLLTLLITIFCFTFLLGMLRSWIHRFFRQTKSIDKDPDI